MQSNKHRQFTFFNKTIKYFIGLALSISSIHAIASSQTSTADHPWIVTASLGYTNYLNMYQNDGQTAVGRLAIGKVMLNENHFDFGVELGVQNGNTMRLGASQATLDVLGGLPIQSTVKPMLDLLATMKTPSFGNLPVFGVIKAGVAYRYWQFNDRTSVNNLSQMAGEIQAGLGYPISQKATINLLYQGIYGSNPDFTVNAVNETGHVSNIPIQQGVLLSVSVAV